MLNNTIKGFLTIAAMFLVSGLQAQDKVVDQVIAVVGNNPILKSDIEQQTIQLQAQGMTTAGDMKCEVLEQLLERRLLLAEAELDTTIIVTDNQINQNLDSRINYFIEHIGSEKEVEKYFKKPLSQLKSEMSESIKEELKTEQMQSKIFQKIKTTPAEVRQFYKQLPKKDIPEVPAQYEYAQITVLPKITEKEDMEVKARLRDFKKRVENGDSFSALAVLYSEDPGSARNGGEMDYVGKGMLDPAFATEAFNLKPGQVSKVVKSEFGYHIIQMIDRKGEKVKVRHILLKPKVEEKELEAAKMRIDSLADYIRKQTLTWEQASFRFSSDKNTRNNGGLVSSPRTGSTRFQAEELDPDVSKIIVNMNIGETSNPFLTVDDKQHQVYKIIKLINKTKPHEANLQEDYQSINDLFLNKKKTDVYQKWLAAKQGKTYIHIDDSYANCNFKLKSWKK